MSSINFTASPSAQKHSRPHNAALFVELHCLRSLSFRQSWQPGLQIFLSHLKSTSTTLLFLVTTINLNKFSNKNKTIQPLILKTHRNTHTKQQFNLSNHYFWFSFQGLNLISSFYCTITHIICRHLWITATLDWKRVRYLTPTQLVTFNHLYFHRLLSLSMSHAFCAS